MWQCDKQVDERRLLEFGVSCKSFTFVLECFSSCLLCSSLYNGVDLVRCSVIGSQCAVSGMFGTCGSVPGGPDSGLTADIPVLTAC